jgi:hypothetical protein
MKISKSGIWKTKIENIKKRLKINPKSTSGMTKIIMQ